MAELLLESASNHFLEGRYEEALKEFDEALGQVSEDQKVVVHANRGAALMSIGDVEAAVIAFDEALKIDSKHVESLHNKGVALSELEKHDQAFDCFSKVCELMPDFYAGQCGKSEALASLGRFEESVLVAEEAIKLEPDSTTGYVNKAFALLKLKQFHDASKCYDLALELGDDSSETKRLLSVSLAQEALELESLGKGDEALLLLERANALHPTCTNLHNQGIILLHSQKVSEAIDCFKRALTEEDSYYESHAALGAIYAQQQLNIEEAKKHLEKACQLEPKLIETRYNLGVVKIKLSDVNGARKEWNQVLEISPNEPHATEALRILDAALAEAKAKGTDGKAETTAAARKISTASVSPPSGENMKSPLVEEAEKQQQHLEEETKRSYVRDVTTTTDKNTTPSSELESALTKVNNDPVAKERRKSAYQNLAVPSNGAASILPTKSTKNYLQPGPDCIFPYPDLKNKCPEGLDPTRREEYLSPEEFMKLFGKTLQEVNEYPLWKKIREKKRLGLF